MKNIRDIHFITLPAVQAEWWSELCQFFGISVRVFPSDLKGALSVMTVCDPVDRRAAWELFVGEFCTKMEAT